MIHLRITTIMYHLSTKEMTQEENNQSNPEYETFYNINGSAFSQQINGMGEKDCYRFKEI